jgi:hypothetical protein
MGIKFYCPNGHKLNVKSFLSGKKAICPKCGTKVIVPAESQAPPPNAEPDEPSAATNGSAAAQPAAAKATSAAAVFAAAPAGATSASANFGQSAMPGAGGFATGATVAPGGQQMPRSMSAPAVATAAPVATAPTAAAPAAMAPTAPATTAAASAPGMRDPIDEAPTAVWYVRPASGGQFGPAPGDTMRAWIDEGRVNATALVWRAGWPEWRSAAATFPKLAATVAAPWGAAPAIAPAPVGAAMPAATNPWGNTAAVNVTPVGAPGMGVTPVGMAPVGMAPVSIAPVGMAMAPVQAAGAAGGLPVGQVVGGNPAALGSYASTPESTDDRVARFRKKRRKRNDATMIVSIILVVLTVVLVIVLAIVLNHEPGPPKVHHLPAANKPKPDVEAPAKARAPVKKAPVEKAEPEESMDEDAPETDE